MVLPTGEGTFSCEDALSPTRAWWSAQPVDLVDFSTEDFPPGTLAGDWHASREGRKRISQRLAEVLDEIGEVEADAAGRQWGACF